MRLLRALGTAIVMMIIFSIAGALILGFCMLMDNLFGMYGVYLGLAGLFFTFLVGLNYYTENV